MSWKQGMLCAALSLLALTVVNAQNVSVAPQGWPHTYLPAQFEDWPIGDPRGLLGDVVVGESMTATYEIASAHIDFSYDPPFVGPPLSIYAISLTDLTSAFELFVPPIPPEMPPGDFVAINITFTPLSLGTFNETLQVVSTDRENPVLQLPISGTGVAPTPIPAPGAILLLLTGLGGMAMPSVRRRLRLTA